MSLRIALAMLLVGAVAGERHLADDLQAVLVNATWHADRHDPVLLQATRSSGYQMFDFHTTPQANMLMDDLYMQTAWPSFLSNVNGALKSGDQIDQNKEAKRLAALFNKGMNMMNWKVTFYSRFTRHDTQTGDFSASHFLKIEPQSSNNEFYEMHMGLEGDWDRACCCKDSAKTNCKHSWSDGKCCKFKYGDLGSSWSDGCSLGWFQNSLPSASKERVVASKSKDLGSSWSDGCKLGVKLVKVEGESRRFQVLD